MATSNTSKKHTRYFVAVVNYSPDELVSLIYMFKSILDTSLLMLVKSLADLSSLISAPCL